MRSKISSRWAQMLPYLGRLEINKNNRTNQIKKAFFGRGQKEHLNEAKHSNQTQWTQCATHWWDKSALTALFVSAKTSLLLKSYQDFKIFLLIMPICLVAICIAVIQSLPFLCSASIIPLSCLFALLLWCWGTFAASKFWFKNFHTTIFLTLRDRPGE